MRKIQKLIFTTLILLLFSCSNAELENNVKEPKYNIFNKIKITDIHPQGWLETFLKRQKTGLTGNIAVAGYPFNTKMWATEKIKGSQKAWWPYEQTAYFIDGVNRLGYLLNDDSLINIARIQTQYVMDHVDEKTGKISTNLQDRWKRWPYASFFRTFMTDFEVTGDQKYVEILHKHYLNFTAKDFADDLELANVEELCWIYEKTNDKQILDMAEEAYHLFKTNINYRNRSEGNHKNDMQFGSDRIPDMHAVVYLELVKIPAILYSYTGKKEYLDEANNGIRKMEKYHMLISGLPSSTEHFRGISDLKGHETCNTAVLPYTYGYFLRITGDAELGDKIEKAVFNAGLGSITKDFKSHQYFSAPNQVIATMESNLYGHNPARMSYSPGHDVECCTGNVNRFMPYYVEQMWLSSRDNGVVASLYGPSAVSVKVGSILEEVHITEETNYPFSEEINFKINVKNKVLFPFYLRIPKWSNSTQIFLNGEKINSKITKGDFFKLEKEFSDGDIITLKMPMEININSLPDNTIGIERGPLVFSLPVEKTKSIVESYKKSTHDFPAYEMKPTNCWNYGIVAKKENFKIETKKVSGYPWDEGNSPIVIKVPTEKVINWKITKVYDEYLKNKVEKTPGIPDKPIFNGEIEYKNLVPYGTTTLRVSVFPKVKN